MRILCSLILALSLLSCGGPSAQQGRAYIIASHLFRTQIADDTSWIIVNETI